MNRITFLVIYLLTVAPILGASWSALYGLRDNLMSHVSSLHDTYIKLNSEQLVTSVREDLLLNNIPQAKSKLLELKESNDVIRFEIIKKDDSEPKPISSAQYEFQRNQVPVYFDADKSSLWGHVVFFYNTKKLKQAVDESSEYINQLLLIIATILLILALVFYFLLGYMIAGILPVIQGIISGKGSSKSSKIIRFLWAPLVSAVDGIVAEVTEARKKEEKTRFHVAIAQGVQMLVHDIKKPFSSIRMYLKTLISLETIEEVRELSNAIYPIVDSQLEKSDRFIADLNFVGLSSPTNASSFEVFALFDSLVGSLRSKIENANVIIKYVIRSEQYMTGDRLKLSRVLLNLLDNAVEASQSNSEIHLIYDVDESIFRLGVLNYGSFIPEEDRERVFEMFYSKGKETGSGLGLAIVKNIVEDHGGRIWIESEETTDGSRTIFWFSIPKR